MKINVFALFMYPMLFLSAALGNFAKADTENGTNAYSCIKLLLGSEDTVISDEIKYALKLMEFPGEYNIPISNVALRQSIYRAYGGRDFYTGSEISLEDMVVDHVIPLARGGVDNIYNYVPTTSYHNGRKNAKVDVNSLVAILSLVRTVYAEKVINEYNKALSTKQNRPIQPRTPPTEEDGITSWAFWEWKPVTDVEALVWEAIYVDLRGRPGVSSSTFEVDLLREVFGEKWESLISEMFRSGTADIVQYSKDSKSTIGGSKLITSVSSQIRTNSDGRQGGEVSIYISNGILDLIRRSNSSKEFIEILKLGVMVDPREQEDGI